MVAYIGNINAIACRALVVGLVVLGLVGCQPQTIGSNGPGSDYNFLYTQADHFKELLDQGKPAEASQVYSAEQQFFHGTGNKYTDLLTRLRSDVEAHFAGLVTPVADDLAATAWPAPPESWPALRDRFAEANTLRDELRGHDILQWGSRSPVRAQLGDAVDDLRKRLTATAATQLMSYGLLTDPPFEEIYPIDVEVAELLADRQVQFAQLVTSYDQDQLLALHARYGDELPDAVSSRLAERYVVLATDAAAAKSGNWLQARLQTLRQAEENGLTVPEALAARIRVIDISSRTSVAAKQLEFRVDLAKDLPASLEEAKLDDALRGKPADKGDVVVLIDIAATKVDRDISKYQPISSERQVGTQTVPNPAYPGAQNAVTQAQFVLQGAQMNKLQIENQYCTGLGCFAKGVAEMAAAARVSQAQNQLSGAMMTLQSTPIMIDEPVFATYQFRRADVQARKSVVVSYYVLDNRANRMYKDNFQVVDTRDFTVAYGLAQEDRYLREHLSGSDSEQDIDDYEKDSMTVEVGTLLQQCVAHHAAGMPIPSLSALRKTIVADKNTVLAKFEPEPVKAVGHSEFDDLADSVVEIFNRENSGLGAGFYVTDELIVTNQHVVDGARSVALKLHSGLESSGKVIAEDVRRDLALIKVEARGAPVSFYDGKALPIGATVIAIGHPRGMAFSLSRGIVSAVREMPPLKVGGNPVWHIQTDTAINPGNSGGPLFLDGMVVGVNTFARREEGDSGLNFSVLYEEVIAFLKAQDVKVRYSKTKVGAAKSTGS